MCFALLALRQHPRYPLILIANRDEYFHRTALPLQVWDDLPAIVGGRDVESGGAWLALNQQTARLALVTNYRAGIPQPAARSRGALVRDVLTSPQPLPETLQLMEQQRDQYGAFNLLAGELSGDFYYLSNRQAAGVSAVSAGLHALSNAYLDTPWPKVQKGKLQFAQLLRQSDTLDVEACFALLHDTTPAADSELPDTGVGLEKERWLSALHIPGEYYGTRCASVIFLDETGQLTFIERSFFPAQPTTEKHLTIDF